MGIVRSRLAMLLFAGIGAVGMVGATAGVASAVTYNNVSVAYPSQAYCEGAHDALARQIGSASVGPCSYYPTPDASVNITSAGWVYRWAGESCGIPCSFPIQTTPDCSKTECDPV